MQPRPSRRRELGQRRLIVHRRCACSGCGLRPLARSRLPRSGARVPGRGRSALGGARLRPLRGGVATAERLRPSLPGRRLMPRSGRYLEQRPPSPAWLDLTINAGDNGCLTVPPGRRSRSPAEPASPGRSPSPSPPSPVASTPNGPNQAPPPVVCDADAASRRPSTFTRARGSPAPTDRGSVSAAQERRYERAWCVAYLLRVKRLLILDDKPDRQVRHPDIERPA
jgi:hypothetical protein